MNELMMFPSRRSAVYTRGGMVAASQPLAVSAGLKVMRQGGNAADAAVAAAAALNITEPMSTGIGGDAFALYYHARSRSVVALNGSGRAPAALTLERLQREGFGESLPPLHAYTVTVPGACSAWCELVERYGRLPLDRVLAPAIRMAEEGFPVAPLTSLFWKRGIETQLKHSLNGLELTLQGRAPEPGEIFRNPGLARTLAAVASRGRRAFYEGPIAEAVASAVQQAGGCLTVADLASHTCTWDSPISIDYRGLRVWECPPNGQGMAALLALNLLEGFDLASLDPLSPESLHLQIEAMRLAFADARHYVADPGFASIPIADLLSKAYADERRKAIDPRHAAPEVRYGTPIAASDTVYFCTADSEGNACSFINSNYLGFGTGIVPKGWGFVLQNRGHNFSLDPQHFNRVAPRKRPYHTIIPGMITRDDDLYAAFGVMGGFMQPQGHVQVVSGLLDAGFDPQLALDKPRFCIDTDGISSGVALEEGIPQACVQALAEMGHPMRQVTGLERSLFGRGQVIRRNPQSGVLCGGSDPRADGCVFGI
jgi:gamma-glutamyltranspeptidase / glutathione hydrolase